MYDGVLKLPKLRKLVSDNIMFDEEGWPSEFEDKSFMEELHIQEFQESFMMFGLACEWTSFKGLTILHLHVESPFLIYHEDYHAHPPQYIQRLQSQAHALENLRLYSNEQYCTTKGSLVDISPHYSNQPSLKHFRKLKSLALTDMALVGVSTAGPAHWHQSFEETLDHLADMFPSTLEVFTHLVWDGPSRFATTVSHQQQMSHSWENVWKASLEDKFPNLKTVMVQKYGLTGVADGSKVIWRRKT